MFEDELTQLAVVHGWSDASLRAAMELLRASRSDPDRTQADTYLDQADLPTEQILASDLPGPMLADPSGRYSFLDLLGEGGMGAVYRVRDHQLKRVLAMKVIRPEVLSRATALSRFIGEAQATAQLQHPGIVPVYDLGKLVDGRWFYTMPQVRGTTLGQAVQEVHRVSAGGLWRTSGSGWSLRRLVEAFRDVCEAVGYAHSRGVVHRDLKPENVMLGAFGEVLVLDWGIAKVLDRPDAPEVEDEGDVDSGEVVTHRSLGGGHVTRAGSVAGTPAYMPPEQAMGELGAIGPVSDVWALGATLYEILHGRPPYEGPSSMNVLMQVVRGPPAPPPIHSAARGSVGAADPGELVEVWVRAMRTDPAERFEDGLAMAEEVAAWLDGARRREQALAVVQRSVELEPEAGALRSRASVLRAAAAELLEGVESWEPEERKRPGWALEDEALALERQAELSEHQAVRVLHGALTHAPDLAEAHAALASRYREEHAQAERAGDVLAADRAGAMLEAHAQALPTGHPDRLRHSAYLTGEGALSLVTDPPGAAVRLFRYTSEHRRLVPVFEGEIGPTPIRERTLPMGSYLLEIEAEGRAVVRYPVQIERQHHWDGVPPGGSGPLPIWLPRSEDLDPDDCYVPAGWFAMGGDALHQEPHPRERVWADGFVARRFPVTNRGYLAFLDDLVVRGREEEALAHVPRERAGGEAQGAMIYGRRPDGGFELRPDSEGDMWDPDWPVLMVDWYRARAYAGWLAESTGRPWRLPADLEWEKAARGVDGRIFPWGDHLDPSWCCMDDSHRGRRLPAVVDSFPVDASPYGVRGLAGNVQDWCADRAFPESPRVAESRVLTPVEIEPTADDRMNTRGGLWTAGAGMCRCTGRLGGSPLQSAYTRGIRVLRPI